MCSRFCESVCIHMYGTRSCAENIFYGNINIFSGLPCDSTIPPFFKEISSAHKSPYISWLKERSNKRTFAGNRQMLFYVATPLTINSLKFYNFTGF